MVDAAGAIYVIGGGNGNTDFQDVWASTDGGADRTRSRGWSGGTRGGYPRGAKGVLEGVIRCTKGVLRGY